MQCVFRSAQAFELFGVAQTRELEHTAQAGLPPNALMQRAGAAAARLALAIAPHAQRVWIAAGPGNNGGDGLEAAMHLAQAGKKVEVSLIADATRLPADARQALARAQAAGVVVDAMPGSDAYGPDQLAIDALLGIGASRAPDGELGLAVGRLNRFAGPVLSLDLPSGLNADTGQPFGDPCVRATHTLSLLTLKPGLFTGTARDLVGEVWYDSLDVTRHGAPGAWLAGPSFPSLRAHAQHKGSFGDLAVIGGAAGMAGAALLAARAAHAAGAGRVFVQSLGDAAQSVDVLHPELMFRPDLLHDRSKATALACVVCGCGGGGAVHEVLPAVLALARRLVLDADGLNAIAADTALQQQLRARSSRGLATVITPHPLEAARLLATSTAQIQADRLGSANELARRYGCVAVLKGSGSVVAAPGRVASINPTGNAALATAGTGDVLAGWLGGVWSGRPADDGFDVAVRSVYLHGAAAQESRHAPLRASDLVEAMVGLSELRFEDGRGQLR